MSVTTPLTTLAVDEMNAASAEQTSLQSQLGAQDVAVSAKLATLAMATATLASDNLLELGLRQQLAQVVLPSDADTVVTALEAVLITEQADRAAVAAATDDLAAAQRRRARIAGDLAAATSAVGVTTQAAVLEAASDLLVDAAFAQVGSPEMVALVAAAGTATAEVPYTMALAWIKAVVDVSAGDHTLSDLLARRNAEAHLRDADKTAAVARAVAQLATFATSEAAGATALSAAEAAYSTAVAGLSDIAGNLMNRYGAALVTLTAIAAPEPPARPPTDAERGAIVTAAPDAAVASAKEIAVYDAAVALRVSQTALDVLALAAMATDPDFDVMTSTDAAVVAARTDRDTKATAQGTAEADLVASRSALDMWEAAIPPAVKAQIMAFFDAGTVITQVAALDLTAVRTAVTDAALALATARQTAATKTQVGDRLEAEVADRTAEATAWATVSDARRAALVNGEGSTSWS